MANSSSNWQDYLNPRLVDRLNRPLSKPGMMKMAMGQNIINRCDRFLNRVPLLNQQMQRWGNNITFSSNDVPIVYAQPISLAPEGGRESREQRFQPIVSQNKSSVPPIQRKVDSSQALPVHIQNTETSSPSALNQPYPLPGGQSGRTESQNNPELKSYPAELQAKNSDLKITSANTSQININPRSHLDEGTIINQTTTAEEEIPLVSPQAISMELESREKLSLQAEFSDSPTASANPSQINSAPRSQFDEGTIMNQTATAEEEMPLVSPPANSMELESREKLSLQAEFSDSPTASANPSQINSTPRSQFDEVTIMNQTTTAEEEMPLVSPPANSMELESREKLSLQAKSSNSPTASVNSSQINTNQRSHLDEGTIINQTTTAEEAIPVVSPQAISIELESREKLPLQAKSSNSPTSSVNPSQINTNSRSRSSLPVVNRLNRLVIPQQTPQNNDDQTKSTSIKDQELMVELPRQGPPKVTVQPLTYPMNLAEDEVRNRPNSQNQLFNISRSQVNQNNRQQKIDILPVVPVTSQVNTSSQTRSSPLPLANNSSASNNISQKPDRANQNSKVSNTTKASSPRIFASSSPPTQTFVSARETQPKIDLDAITSKVEKKIMRRLVIESERRGKMR